MRRAVNRAVAQILWMAIIGWTRGFARWLSAPGISDDTSWKESPMQLQLHDYWVLYTDGWVEARHTQRDIFSFDAN